MTDLYDQIVSERGTLRNWMDKVPGLRGYMDRGDRRTADRMLRDYIAAELEKRVDRFVNLEKQILRGGGMSMMSESSEAKTKLQTYISKVKAAAPGYSGFFAAVNVDEEAMDRLYAFDEAQVRYLERLDAQLNAIEMAINNDGDLGGELQNLYNLAQEAIQAFSLREDVLTNLNKAYS